MIEYDKDADGIVTLTMNDPSANANAMNDRYVAAMGEAIDRLSAEDGLTGVVITSAKKTFFVGADLKDMAKRAPDAESLGATVAETLRTIKAQFRRLEKLGKPVVAALNGTALGGGFEIALACHHRIAVDESKARYGLPEVSLGLLPAAGGVTRTVRMLGIQEALMQVLGQGQRRRAAEAKELGLIDELVSARDELVPAAKAWIKAHPSATQPWDASGYKMPGGTPTRPALAQMLPAFPANLRKQLKGAHYPAPHHILCAAVEGAAVDFETALEIETRYFVDLVSGSGARISKSMTKAFFFDLEHINKGGGRPADVPAWRATKVAVLGAGMMGAGIAYSCAKVGMEVVLRDVTLEAASRGKAYSEKILNKAVGRGRRTQGSADEILGRITPTADMADCAGADLVIEAVFEDTALKHKVFGEVEPVVTKDALLCSNTSSLPITGLATGVTRPEDFVGLHFFSPVDKMPLVEIIRGEQSSPAAIARAYDVVLQLGKTPIVVNDSRGFYTSRVFGTFVIEGAALVGEGVNPVSVERAAAQAGYPVGPLAVFDEVSLALAQKVRKEARAALGDDYVPHPGEAVVERMVELERIGKAGGGGFYDYEPARRIWPGLYDEFGGAGKPSMPLDDIKDRLLFAGALEAFKIRSEGVIESAAEANIGSIFGIGFPPWTGGALQFIAGYPGGVEGFVTRAKELATTYGDRFTPPPTLTADTALLT